MAGAKQTRLWAVLSYFPPLFILILFWKKNNDVVFFHAKQATVLWGLFMIGVILMLLPGSFFAVVSPAIAIFIWIIFIYLWIRGVIEAFKGMENYMPMLGEFADELGLFKKIRE